MSINHGGRLLSNYRDPFLFSLLYPHPYTKNEWKTRRRGGASQQKSHASHVLVISATVIA